MEVTMRLATLRTELALILVAASTAKRQGSLVCTTIQSAYRPYAPTAPCSTERGRELRACVVEARPDSAFGHGEDVGNFTVGQAVDGEQ
jgi:hypothetical protein